MEVRIRKKYLHASDRIAEDRITVPVVLGYIIIMSIKYCQT